MSLQVIRVDNSYNLVDGSLHSFLVISDGVREYRIQAAAGDIEQLLGGQAAPIAPTAPLTYEAPPPPQTVEIVEEDTDKIAWSDLPDNVLPALMKSAFVKLKAPMLLTQTAIVSLVADISAHFTEQDWALISTEGLVVPSEPSPLQSLKAPAVTWADGTPMMPSSGARAPVVMKDDNGYPIVDTPDAGEMTDDEDGTQL